MPLQKYEKAVANWDKQHKSTFATLGTNRLCTFFFLGSVRVYRSIVGSDVCFLAETRLTSLDSNDSYNITGFQIILWNNQVWNLPGRPPHGLVCYIKNNLRLLDVQKTSCKHFESILICVQNRLVPLPI